MRDYDVVIVGAGLAGASLALALGKLPLRIALVDHQTSLLPPPPGKALAISAGSHRYLQSLGLTLPAASEIHKVHISQKGSFGNLQLHAQDAEVDALGYLYHEHDLLKALHLLLQNLSNVSLLHPLKLEALDWKNKTLILNDRQITTTVVIGADSTYSSVARLLSVDTHIQEDPESALVCRVSLDHRHQGTAFQRFTDAETFGLIPAGEKCYALIISGENPVIQAWLAKSPEVFLQDLQKRFGYRLGKFTDLSPRLTYPLRRSHAPTALPPGVFLMGNAAHSLHPLAAQGWNLTLKDVACLADQLALALAAQRSLDDPCIAQAYHEARAQDQRETAQFTELLTRAFRPQHPLARLGRALGLTAVDLLSPLRRYLTQRAAGV